MINTELHINASNWHRDTHLHYIFYSPTLYALAFLKRQMAQLQTINIHKIPFKLFHQPYAYLIHDTLKNEYFLIRDHFGLEPFYYTIINEEKLCFGANLPDILAHIKNPAQDTQQITNVLMDICISNLEYTDNTYYKNVLRVTPGHILQLNIDSNPIAHQHTFWQLIPGSPTIHYATDADYDAHFASLLQEACDSCCKTAPDSIALEFSGGLDTAAILTALDSKNLSAQLFMHVGEVEDERRYGEQLLKELQSSYPMHYVNADDFDVIAVLDQCKQWFAGGAPYLFFMFAANIHQAVQQSGCKILLSGFGGDECVSSHAPLRTYGAAVGYKKIWQELNATNHAHSIPRRLLQAFKLTNPNVYYCVQHLKSYRSLLARKQLPVHSKSYYSLQEREADWLTGRLSHHVRMRIEYSAIIAKHMGFTYQYPLLYPPLVEFCFALPPEQKRRQGQHRLLMRRYLAKCLSSDLFDRHQKCGDILPGTMPKCQELYKNGQLSNILRGLPYEGIYDYIIKNKLITDDRFFHIDLLRYMFQ